MEPDRIKAETALVEPLTPREKEVLLLLASDLSNREIAERLTLALSTVKWYVKQILGKLGASNRGDAVELAEKLGVIRTASSRDNLPAPISTYVGREGETQEILRMLKDPKCRLLTITGMGGIGKTSLAIRVARTLLDEAATSFQDGMYFIPIPHSRRPNSLISAISKGLNFPLTGAQEPTDQLSRFLRTKKLLLLLDGHERSPDELEPVGDLLVHAPGVKFLVTSRQALNLREEWRFQLSGLDLPEEGAPNSEDSNAVQLFAQRARQVWPDFSLDNNLDEVVRICRQVEGLPLAIELAASWVRTMSCREIAEEIQQGMSILETSVRDSLERHRSIRTICEQSWSLLSPEQRSVFKKLCIFRGGFPREAAEDIAGATFSIMAGLVDKSMLNKQPDDRYMMHDLMIQFASEKLAEETELERETVNQYRQYYTRLLKDHEDHWKNEKQLSTLELLDSEFENVMNAWDLNIEKGDMESVDQMIGSLCEYLDWQGRLQEGIEICQQVRALIRREGKSDQLNQERGDLLRIRALNWESLFHNQGNNPSEAERSLLQAREWIDQAQPDSDELLFENARYWLQRGKIFTDAGKLQDAESAFLECQVLFHRLEDGWGIGVASYWLGVISIMTWALKNAKSYMAQSVEYFTEQGDLRNIASAKDGLARVLNLLGEFDQSEQLSREALEIARELNNLQRIAWILHSLAWTLMDLGKYEEALDNTRECVSIGTDLGNDLIVAAGRGLSANCLLHLGKYAEALSLAESAQSPERKGVTWEPFIDLVIGEASYALEDFDRALVVFRESSEFLKQARPSIASIPYTWLSLTERALDLQKESIRSWISALELAIETTFELELSLVLIASALHFADRKEYEKAYALKDLFPFNLNIANSDFYRDLLLAPLVSLLEDTAYESDPSTWAWSRDTPLIEIAAQILEDLR